jgi:hypothetical protein
MGHYSIKEIMAVKYDDASWHYGGDFPADLPIEAGATHTGMFVAWALLSGLAGEIFLNDFPNELEILRSRSLPPGKFFMERCDGKFIEDDVNDEGNSFAQAYFDFQNGQYLADYQATLAQDVSNLYYVTDDWENFDRLKPILDKRFAEWKK